MKNVNKYMNLPYNYIIQQMNDESGVYFYSHVLELDGCQSTGETFEEAYENLKDAMKGWIQTKLEAGFEIPLPIGYENYSGKFLIRIPKSLHYKLAIEAKEEGWQGIRIPTVRTWQRQEENINQSEIVYY